MVHFQKTPTRMPSRLGCLTPCATAMLLALWPGQLTTMGAPPYAGKASAEARIRPAVIQPVAQRVPVAGQPPEPLEPIYPRGHHPAHYPMPHETYYQPGASCPVCGVQCDPRTCLLEPGWDAAGPIPWEIFAQGEYVGPHRLPHLPVYRLRADDQLEFVFRLTAEQSPTPYRVQTGDQIRIQSLSAEELSKDVLVEPDGMISLPLLGQIPAAGLTFDQLRSTLEKQYKRFVTEPKIAVTPITIDTRLQELRSTIDNRAGVGGQSITARVTPEGTVQLPAIGSVPANGLTLAELKREVDHRYERIVHGLEITPILVARAPRFIYVVGEVAAPGRYTLEAPTTVMQAIALAGSWNVGAHLRQIVVFRRDDNWRLMATRLDIRGALYRKRPCPADEIWLRDSDIVVVPKHPVLVSDDWIELIFTRGIYGVLPFSTSVSFTDATRL